MTHTNHSTASPAVASTPLLREPTTSEIPVSGPHVSEPSVPIEYSLHLAEQITASLQRSGDEPVPTDGGDRRIDGSLAAWTGLRQDGDAIEAMLAAQVVVTHDLAMAAIGAAVDRTGETACYFGNRVNDACKVARVTLHQIETLARYRAWRIRSASEARQLEQVIRNAEADS